jgi:hypothetical protein
MFLLVPHLVQDVQDMLAQRAESMTASRLHGLRVDCCLMYESQCQGLQRALPVVC